MEEGADVSTQRTASLRFLPYPFEDNGLSLRLAEVFVDERDARAHVDEAQQLIDLSGNSTWNEVRLTLGVTFDPTLLMKLIPEGEWHVPPVELVARLRSKRARLRRSVAFNLGTWTEGSARQTVTVRRDELRHELEITPILVRSLGREPGTSPHAWQPLARLAEGRPWTVRVDKGEVRNRQHLDIRFHDFSELPQTQAQPDSLYYLDCDGPDPILWLNNRDHEVAVVLQAKGTAGPVARSRDVLFAQIQVAVWQQLFGRAAAGVRDGEVEKSWQRAVLERWLPELMPDLADQESRLNELETMSSWADRFELLRRLDALLQTQTRYGALTRKLAEEVSR